MMLKKNDMNALINQVNSLKPKINGIVKKRLAEFRSNDKFSELCFCLLTANYNAERAIKIQEALGKQFCSMSEKQLSKALSDLGYRYPNKRAGYIIEARKHKIVMDRDWLVNNVTGLGMKEASHFLRNVGYNDYAIIDFHIIDLLVRYKLINRPKTLTKNKYLEIEGVLKRIAEKLGISLGELDLYLWYIETGKVLK